jgi:peptide/nickel transport system permease protein
MAQTSAHVNDNAVVLNRRKRISRSQEIWTRFKRRKSAMVAMIVFALLVLVALSAGVLVDYQEDVVTPNIPERLQMPSKAHPLGTDGLGRDILSRMIYGARISLGVAFASVTFQLIVGTFIGAIAGYYGGKIDDVLMRINDVFASIPNLLLAISIATALGHSILNMILAIGIAGTPALVRIVRATVMTVKDQEFVEAGRALGGNDLQIITFHMLPNCVAPIIVQSTLRIASAILATTSLSFLGIGIKPPTPEWGNMLSAGREFLRNAPHITVFPGLAIVITLLSVNLMGDGLRDALDPKLKS